jgi:hypothetical protein
MDRLASPHHAGRATRRAPECNCSQRPLIHTRNGVGQPAFCCASCNSFLRSRREIGTFRITFPVPSTFHSCSGFKSAAAPCPPPATAAVLEGGDDPQPCAITASSEKNEAVAIKRRPNLLMLLKITVVTPRCRVSARHDSWGTKKTPFIRRQGLVRKSVKCQAVASRPGMATPALARREKYQTPLEE